MSIWRWKERIKLSDWFDDILISVLSDYGSLSYSVEYKYRV